MPLFYSLNFIYINITSIISLPYYNIYALVIFCEFDFVLKLYIRVPLALTLRLVYLPGWLF